MIIILILLLIFYICKKKNVEKMNTTIPPDVNSLNDIINNIYNEDIDAIKTLQNFATNIMSSEGLIIDKNITLTGTFNFLPIGIIICYYPPNQTSISAPVGWAICNGTNGTPNLAGRFIGGYDPNNIHDAYKATNEKRDGGTENEKLEIKHIPPHNHGSNNHRHTFNIAHRDYKFNNASGKRREYGLYSYENENDKPYPATGGGGNDHNHGPSGNNESHENRPPYYTLVYIMKL